MNRPPQRCPNCGTVVESNFCPHCGQENENRIVSMRLLLEDAISNFITVDARIPQTLGPLLVKPGFLTREYLAGRRARYARPARLYLAISIIFFFTLSVVSGGMLGTSFLQGDVAGVADSVRVHADSLYAQVDAALRRGLPSHVNVERTPRRLHVVDDSAGISLALERTTQARMREDMQTQFMNRFMNYLPKMMFVMLPFFALLLKLLYLRQQRYYIGHFMLCKIG